MSAPRFDFVILGSGSAAFAAAIRARSLGASVALVERDVVGGTCVNTGCVPSKLLLEAAQHTHDCPSDAFDARETIARKHQLVDHLRKAKYENLIERYGLEFFHGDASFVDAHTLGIGDRTVTAGASLIATGAVASLPLISGLRESGVLTSTTAMNLTRLPNRLAVIGGNAIGLELGQYFSRAGSQVTIFEARSSIAPFEEPEIREALTTSLEREGIAIAAGATITHVQRDGDERVVHARTRDNDSHVSRFDALLVATGRRPDTASLGLDRAGIRTDSTGAIVTDEYLRTDHASVYAAGDVTGAPQFVYVAAYQGALAAENALSGTRKVQNLSTVPRVIFTQPRLAAVGATTAEARTRSQSVETAVLAFGEHLPRAIVNRQSGVLKLVATAGDRKIIGAHMVGEHADEVIQAATYIVQCGLTAANVVDTFHPYLTMAESLRLCAQTFDRDPKSLSCCAS